MKCQVRNHQNEKILTVCMDKQCKNKQRLSCLLCLIESHSTHQKQSVEVDELNVFVREEGKKQINYPQSCSYAQKQIIQGLEQLNILIEHLQKIIKERIEIIKQQNLHDFLKKAGHNQQGNEQWNHLIEGILQYVKVDNCHINLKKFKEGELDEVEEQQIKIIKQSQESFQSIINQIKYNQIKLVKQGFKEDRKNANITIIDELTIKKINATSSAIAFANEGFDPNSQSYAFGFKIMNIIGSVLVGVGNDDGENIPSYLFSNFDKLGHGQYLIGIDNDTFHHSDEQKNNKKNNGMTFKAGDKIQIKYDHTTKILEFRKESEQNTVVSMPITDVKKMLYPCAVLQNPEDQVQLTEN